MLFIAMNIIKEIKETHADIADISTQGMDEKERKAYDMGFNNALSLLGALVDDDIPVVHVAGLDIPEEMTSSEIFNITYDD